MARVEINAGVCGFTTGIIKATEVAAGLALPADGTIKVSQSDDR